MNSTQKDIKKRKSKTNWSRVNRTIHHWGAALCAIPIALVIVTGIMLLLKKEIAWIQPTTQKSTTQTMPSLSFEEILTITQAIPEANIRNWDDIDRIDTRPAKGIIKIQSKNRWEVQLDAANGEVLQVAYRRSGLIESLHDGSFFASWTKLGLFLPSALILFILWVTGVYLFIKLELHKARSRRKRRLQEESINN